MLPGLKSRLVASHLAVAVVAAAAVAIVLSVAFSRLQVAYYKHALLASALALADALEPDFGTQHGAAQARHALRRWAASSPWGIVIVNRDGVLIGAADAGSQHSLEVASTDRLSRTTRSSVVLAAATEDDPYIVASAPIEPQRAPVGLVRAWITLGDYRNAVAPVKRVLFSCLAAVLAASVVFSLVMAQALVVPIRRMRQLSQKVASGDYAIRVENGSGDELGALASDLNSMAARLQELEGTRRDFLGNVSHELRSPVSNIRVTSEVLQRRAGRWGDDSGDLFATIISETERLETLIAELLELSAIESGALRLDLETFELDPFLAETVDSLRPVAGHKGVTLTMQCAEGLMVTADPLRLRRAVRNLLDNALKFTPTGGMVTVSAARSGAKGVQFDVTDTGEGIPAADLPRVFERFYRADKAHGPKGGTGIGLAIVKHIVAAHGGGVQATSREGEGSTFSITLPGTKP